MLTRYIIAVSLLMGASAMQAQTAQEDPLQTVLELSDASKADAQSGEASRKSSITDSNVQAQTTGNPVVETPAKPVSEPASTGNPVEPESAQAPRVSPLPQGRFLASDQAENMRAAAHVLSARQGHVSPGAGLRLEVVFGPNYPVLVCKIELTCLVELEDGEEMLDAPLLSDPVRWEIALRVRDTDVVKTYVALKPRPDASEATLSLFTNRRTYVLLLNPDLVRHTPMLAFHYPDTEQRKIEARIADAKTARARKASAAKAATRAKAAARKVKAQKSGLPTSKGAVPASELNFNFRITGSARFKPVRVYSDGSKTYIDLPAAYRGELPALIATAGNSNGAVNIRVGKGGQQLIADKPLEAFTLMAGRKKITVKKRN